LGIDSPRVVIVESVLAPCHFLLIGYVHSSILATF
jgi:hypothetical protein